MAEPTTVEEIVVTGKRKKPDFAVRTAAKKPAALKAYKPSLRERAQIGMEGLYTRATGREPGYAPRRFMGKASELLDFIPGVGDVIGIDETKRALDRRQYLEAGLTGAGTLLGVVPVVGDVAGKALKGAATPAQQAAEKLAAKYLDPESTRIADWQWRPQEDVKAELGLTEVPPHVVDYGRFMDEQAMRAAKGQMTPRDLLKAYGITRSSMQRKARSLKTAQKYGLELEQLGLEKVRPEGAFSELLGTPEGQAYLDAAQRGQVDDRAIADMMAKFRPYGFQNALGRDLEWGARNLPQRSSEVADMVAAAREGASAPEDWTRFVKDKVTGVDAAKAGFVGAMLGRGDLPTFDARQIILQTGQPTKKATKYLSRKKGEGSVEAVRRLTARMEDLNLALPPELEPYRQHLTHHTVWDKASNEMTTHEDVRNALKNYAGGGLVEKYAEGGPVTTAEKRAALDAAFAKRKARANALAEATRRNLPDLAKQGPGAVVDALKDAYGLGEKYLRSRTPSGVVADVTKGARALRDATTRYATDRAQNPMKVLADAYGVGEDIVTAVPQAVEDVAKLSERAQALKASDPEAARRLQASIAMAALGAVPGVRKGKQAVKAAIKGTPSPLHQVTLEFGRDVARRLEGIVPPDAGLSQWRAAAQRLSGSGLPNNRAVAPKPYSVRPAEVALDPRIENRKGELSKIQNLELGLVPRETSPAPEVSIFDYEGHPFVTSMSDLAAAGDDLVSINDVRFREPFSRRGGQDYMFDNPGSVWGSDKNPAEQHVELARRLQSETGKDVLYMPWTMGPNAVHFSHQPRGIQYMYADAAMSGPERKTLAADIKTVLPDWRGFEDPKSAEMFMRASGKARGALNKMLDKYRMRGGLGLGEATYAATDLSQIGAPLTSLRNVGIIEPRFAASPSSHSSYSYSVPGQGRGVLKEKNIGALALQPSLMKALGYETPFDFPVGVQPGVSSPVRAMQMRPQTGILDNDTLRFIERMLADKK